MAIFKNDLDKYISLIQTEEMVNAHFESFKRYNRNMALGIGLTTGTVAATTYLAIHNNNPEFLLLNFASIAIVKGAISLYDSYQFNKLNPKIDYNNLDKVDYKALARSNRERDRYKGKLKSTPASRFYKEEPVDIEKHFGYESDNDLPVQFLEKEKVAGQVLSEYEMFAQKYELSELTISEQEIEVFVDELEKLLKSKMLAHRIYFYTSEYFKRLLVKSLINYWDEISIDHLLEELKCLINLEYTTEEIEEFKNKLSSSIADLKNNKKVMK